jgi:hypothetical protein
MTLRNCWHMLPRHTIELRAITSYIQLPHPVLFGCCSMTWGCGRCPAVLVTQKASTSLCQYDDVVQGSRSKARCGTCKSNQASTGLARLAYQEQRLRDDIDDAR